MPKYLGILAKVEDLSNSRDGMIPSEETLPRSPFVSENLFLPILLNASS
jgi:hypothetical protein